MCVDRDVSLTEEIGADIIDTGSVVCVFMGEQDGVQTCHRMPEHLLPEIGATVDDDMVPLHLDQDRDPQAFIPGILAQTDRICTADYGDSL